LNKKPSSVCRCCIARRIVKESSPRNRPLK
jgi:hypothetical protein